jgi:hypothetical protein
MFKYVTDDKLKQSKDILVNRDTVAQYDVRGVIMFRHSPKDPANMAAVQTAVATAANHFAALDDGSQEIYFTCTPYKMECQVEIPPSSWAETLPLFSALEVRKRSKWDSSTRMVREREQGAVPGPTPPPPPVIRWWTTRATPIAMILCTSVLLGAYEYKPRSLFVDMGDFLFCLAFVCINIVGLWVFMIVQLEN